MGELRAIAYVSWGVWVAKCPRPWCVHVDHYGPGPQTGRVGGLARAAWHCFRCGLACEAVWPDNADDIWRVLMQRPQYETRNWNPGEELDNLVIENLEHGLITADDLRERGQKVAVINGRLTELGRAVSPAPASLHAIGA